MESIVIGSVNELGYFPFLSLVAMNFLVVLASLLVTVVLLVGYGLVSLLKRKRGWSDEVWVGFFVGLGTAVWIFVYLISDVLRMSGGSKWLIGVFISGIVFIGGIVWLMTYSALSLALRRKKLVERLRKVEGVALLLSLGGWMIVFGLLVVIGMSRVVKGRPGLALQSGSVNTEQKTNVIFITIDALRADSFNEELMPEIFNLSESGVKFTRAYAPSSWTAASFAAIFSGKDPGATGTSVSNFELSEITEAVNLPSKVYSLTEEFRDKGYLTQAIVTNPYLEEERGFNQGFEGYVNLEEVRPYHWYPVSRKVEIVKVYKMLPLIGDKLKEVYDYLLGETTDGWLKTRAEMVSDTALEWMKRRPKDRPFFLWLHYIDPHGPYDPVEDYSPSLDGFTQEQEKIFRKFLLGLRDIRWRDVDIQAIKHLYNGDVMYADKQVGRFLDTLKEEDLLNNTVVVLTSDHGEEFMEHGKIAHGNNFYEEEVRVPLIVKAPQLNEMQGEIIDKAVSTADLGPTLWRLLEGREDPERDWFSKEYSEIIFMEANMYGPELKAVVWKNWKLVWNLSQGFYELYNLKSDMQEKLNLIGKFPEIENKLKTYLEERVERNEKAFKAFKEQGDFEEAKEFGEVVGY